jgi:hypothetical protein
MSTVDLPESEQKREAQMSAQPETSDRTERFRADVAAMRLSDSNPSLERGLTILGWALIIVGVIVAIMAIVVDLGSATAYTSNGPASQRDAIVEGVAAVTFAIAGLALVIRFSFAKFLRFWLARLIYEQQSATDRIVAGK